MKKLQVVTAILLYLASLFFSTSVAFAQEKNSQIILSPSYQELGVGKEFKVDILVKTSVETVGSDVYIDYDPRVIEVVSVDVGESFDKVPLKEAKDGSIKITALEDQGNTFSGLGRIATLHLKTIDAGDTALRVKFESGATTDSNIVSTKVTDTLSKVDEGKFLAGDAFERSLGAAKRLAFRAIPIFIFLIFAGIAAYVGYRWWKKQQEGPKDVFIPKEVPLDRPPQGE
ncbi:MAG: hypothetical protein A2Z11_03005 [Candidatus Woykebacteria bacterium RBG_16_43_9]|uniref:Cohesin domain-containing protein n=1 Tax=Candidatus Woykebacteria bacterium RBG_16_43_9 TaxID=1802596 RepID=A0A1G1WC74_9BACT|nr:MAG: hypothetical protein A2Z11_03005 [Candidatus Woykebacteria bacterium RBG_16_43_9]